MRARPISVRVLVLNDPVGGRLRGSREKVDALASDDLTMAALETAGRAGRPTVGRKLGAYTRKRFSLSLSLSISCSLSWGRANARCLLIPTDASLTYFHE